MRRLKAANLNTAEYWDQVYASEIAQGLVRFSLGDNPQRFRTVLDQVPERGGALLDYAGGWGELAGYLALGRPHWCVSVYERSAVARNYGRTRFPHLTFLAEPPHDPAYSFVHCGQTLEHVDDPGELLAYLWGVVAHEGQLLVSVPYHSLLVEDTEHVWAFEPADLTTLLPDGLTWALGEFLFGLWRKG